MSSLADRSRPSANLLLLGPGCTLSGGDIILGEPGVIGGGFINVGNGDPNELMSLNIQLNRAAGDKQRSSGKSTARPRSDHLRDDHRRPQLQHRQGRCWPTHPQRGANVHFQGGVQIEPGSGGILQITNKDALGTPDSDPESQ